MRKRTSAALRYALMAQILCLGHVTAAAETGKEPKIWQRVSAAAKVAGDRKALWRELKKLSAAELLVCGRQFCQSAEQGREKVGTFRLVITTNAILSYHQKKLGYEATARAVGSIIATSDTANWVYGSMEWIENNKHYRHISKAGMHAIAEGILRSLHSPDRPVNVQVVVLKKLTSDDILRSLAKSDRDQIVAKCRALVLQSRDKRTTQRAQRTLKSIEAWMKENPEESPIAINVSVELSSDDLAALGRLLLRSEDAATRLCAVKLLGKLKNTKRAPHGCRYLVKCFDQEPNAAVKNEILKSALRLDRDGKLLQKILSRSRSAAASGFWKALERVRHEAKTPEEKEPEARTGTPPGGK